MAALCLFVFCVVQLSLASFGTAQSSNTYTVKNGGKQCMVVKIAARFTVAYEQINMTGNETADATIDLPAEGGSATLNQSICAKEGAGVARLTVEFRKSGSGPMKQKFEIIFSWNASAANSDYTKSTWSVSRVSLTYSLSDEDYFPNALYPERTVTVVTLSPGFSGKGGYQYKCLATSSISLKGDGETATMKYHDLLLNPFNVASGDVDICAADKKKTDKVVPIAVGCALAGLLLLVIIAWLVGRKSKKPGYKEV